jgi:hypothetical protein
MACTAIYRRNSTIYREMAAGEWKMVAWPPMPGYFCVMKAGKSEKG